MITIVNQDKNNAYNYNNTKKIYWGETSKGLYTIILETKDNDKRGIFYCQTKLEVKNKFMSLLNDINYAGKGGDTVIYM